MNSGSFYLGQGICFIVDNDGFYFFFVRISLAYKLFIMCPHSEYPHSLLIFENFINQAMLNINSSGIETRKISFEFFK